jgi:hypothetical protein
MPFNIKKLIDLMNRGEFYLLDPEQIQEISGELSKRAISGNITAEERKLATALEINIKSDEPRTLTEGEKGRYADVRRKIAAHELTMEEGREVMSDLAAHHGAGTITQDERQLIQELLSDARRQTAEQLERERQVQVTVGEATRGRVEFAEQLRESMATRQAKNLSIKRATERKKLEPTEGFAPTPEQERAIEDLAERGEVLTTKEAEYYNKTIKPRIEAQAVAERAQLLQEFTEQSAAKIREERGTGKPVEVHREEYGEIVRAAEAKAQKEIRILSFTEPTAAEIARHHEYTMEAVAHTFKVVPTIGERAQAAWESVRSVMTGVTPEVEYGFLHSAEQRHELRQIGLIESPEEKTARIKQRSTQLVREILGRGVKREISTPDFERVKGKLTAKVEQELELMGIERESPEGIRHMSHAQAALRAATQVVPTTGEKISAAIKENAAALEESLGGYVERPAGLASEIAQRFEAEADKSYKETAISMAEELTGITEREFKKELRHIIKSEIVRKIRSEVVERYGMYLPEAVVSKIQPAPRTPFELGSYLKGKITREVRSYIIRKVAGKIKDVALEHIQEAWREVFPEGGETVEDVEEAGQRAGGFLTEKSSYRLTQTLREQETLKKRQAQELEYEQEERTRSAWGTLTEPMREVYERLAGGKQVSVAPEEKGLTPEQIRQERSARRIAKGMKERGRELTEWAESAILAGEEEEKKIKSSLGYAVFDIGEERLRSIEQERSRLVTEKTVGKIYEETSTEEIRKQLHIATSEAIQHGLGQQLSIEKQAEMEKLGPSYSREREAFITMGAMGGASITQPISAETATRFIQRTIPSESLRTIALSKVIRTEVARSVEEARARALPPPTITPALPAPPPKMALPQPDIKAVEATAARLKAASKQASQRITTLSEEQALPVEEAQIVEAPHTQVHISTAEELPRATIQERPKVQTAQRGRQLRQATETTSTITVETAEPIEGQRYARATVSPAQHQIPATQFTVTAQIEPSPQSRQPATTLTTITQTQELPQGTGTRRLASGAEYRGPLEITIEQEQAPRESRTSTRRLTSRPTSAITGFDTGFAEETPAIPTATEPTIRAESTAPVGGRVAAEYTKTAEHLIRRLYPTTTGAEKAKPVRFDPFQALLGDSDWAEWVGRKVREGIDVFTQSESRASVARRALEGVRSVVNPSGAKSKPLAIEEKASTTVERRPATKPTEELYDVQMEDITPDTVVTDIDDFSHYQRRLDILLERDRPVPPEHQAIVASDPNIQALERRVTRIMPVTQQDRARAAEVGEILSGRRELSRRGYRAVSADTLPGERETRVVPERTGRPGQRVVVVSSEGPGRLAAPVGFGQESPGKAIGIGLAKDLVVGAARSAFKRGITSIFGESAAGAEQAGTAAARAAAGAAETGAAAAETGVAAAAGAAETGAVAAGGAVGAAESGAAAVAAAGVEVGVTAGAEAAAVGLTTAAAATSWIPIFGEIMMAVALAVDVGTTIYGAVKSVKSQKEAENLQGQAKDVYWAGRSGEEAKNKRSDGNLVIPVRSWSPSFNKFSGFGYGMTIDQRRSPGLYGL